MKREDIIDSLEYIDEEWIEEADRVRSGKQPAGESGKVIPVRRKPLPVRRWGTLAAGFAVLIIAAFAFTGILRVRSGKMDTMQSAEAIDVDSNQPEQYPPEKAEEAAAEEYAAEEAPIQTPEPENYAAEEASVPESEEYAAEETADLYAAEKSAGAAEKIYEAEDMTATAKADEAEEAAAADESVLIRVASDAGEIVFALNDTPAAKSLASQLPLTAETELYSDNEIVFHPDQPLDTENGMEGGGTAGYLGYFAPWNNVVMYYGDFDEYPGLYILGEAVSGAEIIKDIRGSITIGPA